MTLKRGDHHHHQQLEHAYHNLPHNPSTPPPSPPPRKPNSEPPVVLLLYSKCCSVALEWARYLDRVYHILSKSKKELTIRHVPLEDLGGGPLPRQLSEASLQVLLLSRPLLNLLLRRPDIRFGAFLRPERVLGIMLGVEDALLNARHRESLASFDQWVHLEAKHNDTAFVHTVINFSIQILQKPESKINNLDKARRIMYCNNAPPLPTASYSFQAFPRTLYEKGDATLLLVFQSPINEIIHSLRVFLRRMPQKLPPLPLEKIQLLNPYSLSCVLPACAFLLRTSEAYLFIECNGVRLDFKEPMVSLVSAADQFETALNTVTDPVRVLCTTYGINPPCKNRLDETLTEAFLSKRSSFLLSASIESLSPEDEQEEEKAQKGEFPTLLHFACHYGFMKLTKTLLDCPAFERALDIRNELGCTPSDLARNNGFFALAHTLDDKVAASLLMHEYSDIMDANYSIPPAPIPVKLRGKSSAGTLRPKRASALDVVFEPDRFDHDRYGTMKGNKAISKRLDFEPPKQQEIEVGKEFKEDLAVADELLKLLDDFQKNSYSFTEMENLFKKWRRRKAEIPDEKKNASLTLNKKTSTFRKLFARNNKKNTEEQKKTSSISTTTTTTTTTDCYQTDENELSVVVFPPSPGGDSHSRNSVSNNNSSDNVSSQILPLSRISSISSHSRRSVSPSPDCDETIVGTPVREVAPDIHKSLGSALNEIHFTPQSVDEEESILNTPKSLLPVEGNEVAHEEEEDKAGVVLGGEDSEQSHKKQLFPSSTTTFVPQQLEEYANLPSMIITDFE